MPSKLQKRFYAGSVLLAKTIKRAIMQNKQRRKVANKKKASLNSGAHEKLLENDIDIDWHIMTYSVFIVEPCFGNYINSSHPTFEWLLKLLSTQVFFFRCQPYYK